jgi:hypothetical protein
MNESHVSKLFLKTLAISFMDLWFVNLVGTCAEAVVFLGGGGGCFGLAVFKAGGCCVGDVDTEIQEVEAKASGLHKQRSVCTHGL